MTIENFPVETMMWTVAAVSALALLVNLKFKLPRKIFFVLALLMIMLTFWYAMGGAIPESVKKGLPAELFKAPPTSARIRALSFETFSVNGTATIPLREKSEKIIAAKFFIDAPPKNSSAPEISADAFSFSLVRENGREEKNLAVAADNEMIPPKIIAIFKFDSEEDLANFSALKISALGVPAYSAKGVLLESVSEIKED